MGETKKGNIKKEYKDLKSFRFVERDNQIGRSTGRFRIRRIGENSSYIYLEDWFHTIASWSTGKLIFFILGLYLISVIIWATMFYIFRDYGFVDISTFVAALIISLETITTVGYSVTDINFGDHPIAFILLYGEMMQSILMNSFCIGVVYTRISRAIIRSRSIIFSDKAIIRKINGQWCFLFQICELRKSQLIESHVTCYCVQKTVNKTSGVPFQMSRLTLSNPSNAHTGHFVLMLPALICHPIDESSLLYPDPDELESATDTHDEFSGNHSIRLSRCFTSSHIEPNRRSTALSIDFEAKGLLPSSPDRADTTTSKSTDVKDKLNSEMSSDSDSDDTISRLVEQDKGNILKVQDSTSTLQKAITDNVTHKQILDHIRKNGLEIVVIVEGTESVTSSRLQARFSYAAEDIVANRMFAPCVKTDANGNAEIDFVKYHQTVPIDTSNVSQEGLFIQSIL